MNTDPVHLVDKLHSILMTIYRKTKLLDLTKKPHGCPATSLKAKCMYALIIKNNYSEHGLQLCD